MIKNRFLTVSMVLAVFVTMGVPAHAADPKLIAKHDKWGSYVIDEGGNKVCYMASSPDKQEGHLNGKNRGDVYALVTERGSDRDVFTFISGYTYKARSTVTLSVDGGKAFTLFTKDDSAWAPPGGMDGQITKAIRKGTKMVVKGASARGTKTIDTFSLKGAGAAYQDIVKACDL